jgi:hypothetical protein
MPGLIGFFGYRGRRACARQGSQVEPSRRREGVICSCSLPRQTDWPGSDLSLRVTILQQGVADRRKPLAALERQAERESADPRGLPKDSAKDLSKGWRFFATYTEV